MSFDDRDIGMRNVAAAWDHNRVTSGDSDRA
jgi:hypothetical protein